MAAFPTEIFELIIDVFWPNRQSLLACALTCRAWLPWSRFNICYDVQIANCDQLVAFLNLLRKEPHLGDIVRVLHLANVAKFTTQSRIIKLLPHLLLARLTNVTTLKIGDAGGSMLNSTALNAHCVDTFYKLRFCYQTRGHQSQICDFLGVWPPRLRIFWTLRIYLSRCDMEGRQFRFFRLRTIQVLLKKFRRVRR
ncbi:hypothetical protein AcV7_010401 [Taiwanofungus camphoratus]|nr:hypothetical protein AcV7_010401 [Antrodia cinnamomea]